MQSVVCSTRARVEAVDPVTGERDWLWADDIQQSGDAPSPSEAPEAVPSNDGDPIDAAVQALREVDRSMAVVLRAVADAGPADGLPASRHVALRAQATGFDLRFLQRAVQVLGAMPRTWAAFDDGGLSWSQLRGIVVHARRLSAAQRQLLDDALARPIADGRAMGEPDRVVEVAGDLVARLDAAGQESTEAGTERDQRLVLQPDFDGGGEIHGYLGTELFPVAASALDAAADPPVATDAPPATDDDGQQLPKAAQPVRSRSGQLAEALGRICTAFLGGGSPAAADDDAGAPSRRARPTVFVVTSLAELLDHDLGVGSVVSRLLLRRGTGRQRISRALVRHLAEDADLVPIFTDDQHMPVAIGDSYSPISPSLRRTVIARDQGCRMPGCDVPAEWCDINHAVPRAQGGPTELANLHLVCRPDHVKLTRHRWPLRLDPDGTLHVTIGRRTYVTRPRLRPPG